MHFVQRSADAIPQITDLSPYTWNEENLRKYREELSEQTSAPEGRKLFYIEPKGTLNQNDLLIALTINYIQHNVQEDVLLQDLLRYEHRLFRVEYMSETEPGSGEFQHRACDLLGEIVKRKDVSLLRKLYEHIDFEIYAEHKDAIDKLLRE